MIDPTASNDRSFLCIAQPRHRLTGIEHKKVTAGFLDGLRRQACYTAELLQEIQCRALGSQKAPCGAFTLKNRLPRLHGIAVLSTPFKLPIGAANLKGCLGKCATR